MAMRRAWIDTAKGLGIFLVVFGHALAPAGLVPTIIWVFHMPLFFFLAGLTSKEPIPGSELKFLRGLKSLIIPYIFFSLISIACWSIVKGNTLTGETCLQQLAQMAYGVAGPKETMHYNIPLWFFTCLILVRLLFAALTSTSSSNAVRYACVIMAAAFAHCAIFPRFESMIWNFDVALVALVFFFSGYTLQGIDLSSARHNVGSRVAIGLGVLFLFGATIAINGRVDMNGRRFGNPIMFYIGAFAGITLMVDLAKRLEGIGTLNALGRASIVIFPVHALFWLLPPRFFSNIAWYATRIIDSDIFVSFVVSVIEIAACMPIHFALKRWAPFLIGQHAMAKRATIARNFGRSA